MIERNQYLSKLLSAKNNDFSKFIAGIRKCYEIDFISNDISSLETKTREIWTFIALIDSFQQIDNLRSLDSNDFIIIAIADFLLRFIK